MEGALETIDQNNQITQSCGEIINPDFMEKYNILPEDEVIVMSGESFKDFCIT